MLRGAKDMERNSLDWHKGQACEILGVSRPRLRRMIRQYDLVPPGGIDVDADDES